MAAMVSAWSTKPGAWALDSEQNESDLLHHEHQQQDDSSADFPSLAAAAASKPKKKKSQPLSLAQFNSDFSSKPPSLTHDDLLILPTGPRERSQEELDRSRLGGGFRSYGSYGDDSSRRQGGFGRDRDRDRDSSSRDPLPPSRADETADWGANKKLTSLGSFERRDRDRGGFFGSSKADEVDNWASGKSSSEAHRISGDGARSGRGWSRGGFEGLSSGNGADGDRWGRKREDDGDSNLGNSSSARPRLVLQPRSVPLEGNTISKERGKGSNPFGDARPREEVLKEKGKDWKEIDEKLEAVKIKDVAEDRWDKRGPGGGRAQQDDDKVERSWRKARDDDVVDAEPKAVAAAADRVEKEEEDRVLGN